ECQHHGASPMADAFLLAAARAPIGKYLGGLADLSAPQLGAVAVAEALRRAQVPAGRVDEVIMGNVLQAGVGQNPARQAALKAGLPDTVAAFTVNKVCGSGLKAVMLAAQAIRAGDADVVLAGGMESMSRAPYLLMGARADASAEGLAKLKPAFKEGGTVTAGNASMLSDGAAAVAVVSPRAVEQLGVTPLARVVAYATSGIAPKEIFLAPIAAVRQVL